MFLERPHSAPLTLADIPPRMRVRILNMDNLPVERRDHLFAFGLAPGEWVEIKQHRPAIVAQVDYTELALELEDAARILVEMPRPIRGFRHYKRRAARRGRHARRSSMRRGRRKWRRRFLARLFGIDNND
jgi:Fe2+ transport system protein FeoA